MKKRKYLIFLLMGCLFPCVLWAQNAKTQKVTLQLKEASVKEFFDALHQQTKLNFVYNNEQIKSIPSINVTAKNESLTNVLDRIKELQEIIYHPSKIRGVKALLQAGGFRTPYFYPSSYNTHSC